jgi:hypothetical protein
VTEHGLAIRFNVLAVLDTSGHRREKLSQPGLALFNR